MNFQIQDHMQLKIVSITNKLQIIINDTLKNTKNLSDFYINFTEYTKYIS